MNVKITPARLSGCVNSVSSKSDGHRKIIAAALSDKPTKIIMNNFSDDIDATLECIKNLGGGYERYEDGVLVTPISGKVTEASLDFHESGSTARFLLPVASALCENVRCTGRGRLPERPLYELTNQLRLHGKEVDNDLLPLTARGVLRGGEYEISGNVSSQYLTGLLFTLPLLSGESKIILKTPLASAPYVDMTLDTLSEFGVKVEHGENKYIIKNQKYISPENVEVEGDWSSAAFWIVANAICGDVSVFGMNRNSRQGDMKILDILNETEIDASQIPDLVPILSILAAAKCGKTIIRGAERLKHKESDRVRAMTECINNLGGSARVTCDGMEIVGTGKLVGGKVEGFGDHRVVMSAVIASCICENEVEIAGAEAVKKSYPTFFEDFKRLGGKFHVSDGE